ncbi:MAG: alanine--tRNA ligase [Deltaproteobacteria bacterium]|nr:alanine--tRNA ligase [Deltaproteobacteria bacterium]
MKTGKEIRQTFLDYFRDQGHEVVKSASLIPRDDPTLLFTNAGMVPFKRIFLGEERREYSRAVSSQKCVRAGGKHNDLENVGRTARHHTFFEMLGNFSFGDYFKPEAINLAWNLLVKVYNLPEEKLYVSVYEKDDEAYKIWHQKIGISKEKIVRLGDKDNFWSMGDTGPCGPCSEILIDQGPELGCDRPDCAPGCDCDRYLEIWNLVFMQFNRDSNGVLLPLPKPSIDTGMGLERITAVIQGVPNNFQTDLFRDIILAIETLSGTRIGQKEETDIAIKVIADHSRALAFLLADGAIPSNEGRGYVVRRILRRAARFGKVLGINKPFLHGLAEVVAEVMSDIFPEVKEQIPFTSQVIQKEEERFLETLDYGLKVLNDELDRLRLQKENVLPGALVFKLYDTYGFPLDIIQDVIRNQDLRLDQEGFDLHMERQREMSRQAWKGSGERELEDVYKDLMARDLKNEFIGYTTLEKESPILALIQEGKETKQAIAPGEIELVAAETPFYAESGGQSGDQGTITSKQGWLSVETTFALPNGLILHRGRLQEGTLKVGDRVILSVSNDWRSSTANNHTATHLLHGSLRRILGDQVKQAGSLVSPQRLRFDFSHYSALSLKELQAVEDLVNAQIQKNFPVDTKVMAYEEAKATGAIALFEERYGDRVRLVRIGDFSQELCGGTHSSRTGNLGFFKILSEGSVASGVRRIEAVTGKEAVKIVHQTEERLKALGELLKVGPEDLGLRIEKLLAQQKELERTIARLNKTLLGGGGIEKILEGAREIQGIKILSTPVPISESKELRDMADSLRDRLGSGIVILGGVNDEKVLLVTMVSKDLTRKFQAGKIIKRIANALGGDGGGRPDMAQAGGNRPDLLETILAQVYEWIGEEGGSGKG